MSLGNEAIRTSRASLNSKNPREASSKENGTLGKREQTGPFNPKAINNQQILIASGHVLKKAKYVVNDVDTSHQRPSFPIFLKDR